MSFPTFCYRESVSNFSYELTHKFDGYPWFQGRDVSKKIWYKNMPGGRNANCSTRFISSSLTSRSFGLLLVFASDSLIRSLQITFNNILPTSSSLGNIVKMAYSQFYSAKSFALQLTVQGHRFQLTSNVKKSLIRAKFRVCNVFRRQIIAFFDFLLLFSCLRNAPQLTELIQQFQELLKMRNTKIIIIENKARNNVIKTLFQLLRRSNEKLNIETASWEKCKVVRSRWLEIYWL